MGKILFVSNRSEKIKQYREIMKKHDFTVAESESSAIEAVEITQFDIIIFDDNLDKNIMKKLKSVTNKPSFILLTKFSLYILP